MSGHLNLFAEAVQVVEVPIAATALRSGARAVDSAGRPFFAHRHLPSTPSVIDGDPRWQATLDLGEEALRGEDPTRAVRDLERPCCYGGHIGTGGPGRRFVTASSHGVEVGLGASRSLVRWSGVFAALAERREVELQIARVRDLGEADRRLDYYGCVYEGMAWSEDLTPVPLIRGLASAARSLGGDPDRLPQRTDYMREGTRS